MISRKVLLLFVPVVFLAGCSSGSDQIDAIVNNLFQNTLFFIPFIFGIGAVIFLMNKFIAINGITNDRWCSILGVIIFPIGFYFILSARFGTNWIAVTIYIVLGLLIGWFSYVTDELILGFWENRIITVPGLFGLILGGVMFITFFSSVWLEGNMYVMKKACATRIIIERYTQHYDSEDETYYYTWDYHKSVPKIVLGTTFPILVEGKDYSLGKGYGGRKDRIGRTEKYCFIGGTFWSERKGRWSPFTWLRLHGNWLGFVVGQVNLVRSNFYGNPIENGGIVEEIDTGNAGSSKAVLPEIPKRFNLPYNENLPNPTIVGKAFGYFIDTVKQLFIEDEYRSVLYFIGIVIVPWLVMLFFPAVRPSAIAFLICFFVIVLIFLLLMAARTGSLGKLGWGRRKRRFAPGGGRFGGGGTSGKW
jgi:hypothetical protein